MSMRELAMIAGVSPSTLQHYFETREALIDAALTESCELGRPYMDMGVFFDAADVTASLEWFLRFSVTGWRHFGVGRVHAFGLRAGLDDDGVGPCYVSRILEPSLDTAERRLQKHVDRGELAIPDLRAAALSFFAPVVLALLHQDALSGRRIRSLDVDAFIRHHVAGFVRAYAPTGASTTRVSA